MKKQHVKISRKKSPKKAAGKKHAPRKSAVKKVKIMKLSPEFQKLKNILVLKRNDLMKMVLRKKHNDLPEIEVGDEGDTAVQSLEREILFELTDNEQIMLEKTEEALAKFESNRYGICESCNKSIPVKRLKAMAWARYCISCQNKSE